MTFRPKTKKAKTLGASLRRLAPVAVVSAALPLTMGCDGKVQEQLDQGRDAYFTAAEDEIKKVESARNTALTASLPAEDAVFEKDAADHPLVKWRKDTALRDDAAVLRHIARYPQPTPLKTFNDFLEETGRVSLRALRDGTYEPDEADLKAYEEAYPALAGALGTPAVSAATIGAEYLKDAADFWAGLTAKSRYLQGLSAYEEGTERARAEAKDNVGGVFVKPPFVDETEFDKWFIHAATFLQLQNIEDRPLAWARMHSSYGDAFGLARQSAEGTADYISRLCFVNAELKSECKGVAGELRPAIVDRKYLSKLQGWAKEYKATGDTAEVFNTVAQRVVGILDESLKGDIATDEGIVLPSTTAAVAGRNGVSLAFTNNGIIAMGTKPVLLGNAWTGTVPRNLKADLERFLLELKEEPGSRVDYQRIVLEIEGKTPFSTIDEIVKSFPVIIGEVSGVRHVYFLARRRVDESMRLASLQLTLPPSTHTGVMNYRFKEDGSDSRCTMLGRVGTPPPGRKDEYDIEFKNGRIRAAKVTIEETETSTQRVYEDSVDLGSASDLSQLRSWLDEHPGVMRLFIPRRGSYDDFVGLVSDLLFRCEDEKLSVADGSSEEVVRTCGKSTQRDNAFVVGLCQ